MIWINKWIFWLKNFFCVTFSACFGVYCLNLTVCLKYTTRIKLFNHYHDCSFFCCCLCCYCYYCNQRRISKFWSRLTGKLISCYCPHCLFFHELCMSFRSKHRTKKVAEKRKYFSKMIICGGTPFFTSNDYPEGDQS